MRLEANRTRITDAGSTRQGMTRRRPPSSSDQTSLAKNGAYNISYEKDNKTNRGIRFLGTSVGIIAIIFVLFILVVADFLDSIHSAAPHFGPNNEDRQNSSMANGAKLTVGDNGSGGLADSPPTNRTDGSTLSAALATDREREIPYIRYDTMGIKAIKERFDYASSHGDADNPDNLNNTVGQHLLDFGIIGFPKCGTTTMMRWLNMHNEIAVITKENMALQKRHPVAILRAITATLPEGRYRRGYKSPNDVEDGRARNKLRIHYPNTRLIVGLRHPVLWYESFYNFRIQNGFVMPDFTEFLSRKNTAFRCVSIWNGACMERANYHVQLAAWGKTPLLSTNQEDYASFYDAGYDAKNEWKIFEKNVQKNLMQNVNNTAISPNPMFLYDVSQLRTPPTIDNGTNDKDEKRSQKHYEDFVLSLQDFLGVPKNVSAMPAMIREKPGRTEGINVTEQLRRNKLKIDMCDDKFEPFRNSLIKVGANVAEWITKYFAKSPHGVFLGGNVGNTNDGSSRFLEIIESYGKDPCPDRRSRKHAK